MLGGAGSMFTSGPTDAGSGVNWEVTKDTARKTVASPVRTQAPTRRSSVPLPTPCRSPRFGLTRRPASRG